MLKTEDDVPFRKSTLPGVLNIVVPRIVFVPLALPMFSAVLAPPAKFTVVAVAFTRANVVLGVVMLVVMAGDVIDCTPVKVCAPLLIASVPLSGSVTVPVPSAPVAGWSVVVPEVALRKPMLPTALPAVPRRRLVVEVNVPLANEAEPSLPSMDAVVVPPLSLAFSVPACP